MKKLIIVLLIVFTSTLYGLHNEFPIGVYSCPNTDNCITLMEKADSAHFNLLGMSYNQIGETYFWDALYRADTMELDVRISDDVPVDDGGSQKAARCNYFWYDAENSLNDGLEQYFQECHDYWYYGVRSENNNTGSVNVDELDPYSHNMKYAWICSENAGNSAGDAVEFLKLKHVNRGLNSQIVYQNGIIDTFFFDFVLKYQDTPAHSSETVVCTLQVMAQDTLGNYIPITLYPVQGANYDTVLTEEKLVENSIFPEYTYYQFYTPWDEFPASISKSGGRLHYVFFQIYWNGVGDLYIDGMQIEDNFYRKLKNNKGEILSTQKITLIK